MLRQAGIEVRISRLYNNWGGMVTQADMGDLDIDIVGDDAIYVAATGPGEIMATFTEIPDPESQCSCPIGLWAAGPEQTIDLLLTLYSTFGIGGIMYVEGDIEMRFSEDGSYRFDYRETTFDAVIDGQQARFILNGGSFGTWATRC